jgi:amino acid adenylation domain-containing protein/thioester reductase-like protein
MRIITFAITGQTLLGASVARALHELGHRVVLADTRDGPLSDVCSELAIAAATQETAQRRTQWLLACGDREDLGTLQGAGVLEFQVLGAAIDDGHVRIEWRCWRASIEPASFEAETICLTDFENGADRKRTIEERARALLLKICRRISLGVEPLAASAPSEGHYVVPVDLELLQWWHASNENTRHFATDASLLEMVQRTTDAVPDAVALIDKDGSLSYSALIAAAVQIEFALLTALHDHGNRAMPVIAVMLPKYRALYAAILGVLRVGGAYVPIDPSLPAQRVSSILEESRADVLITESGAGHHARSGRIMLSIDEIDLDNDQGINHSCALLLDPLRSSRCAVAIFTSGSTGKPKGVRLSHGNIVNFSYWYRSHVCLSRAARVLQFSTIAFDASLLDIFPTWLAGGTLIVPTEAQRHDFDRLHELVDRHEVTHAFLPPALLAELPDVAWPSLAHLVTGGDVCDPATIERWSANRVLHNIYGPTECTVLATATELKSGEDRWRIGKPIANVTCQVLDAELRPVCTGEPGELYIGGAGVGLGYIDQPELTRERFLPAPIHGKGDARVFRTGDIVQWEASGTLRFVGRRDSQVKIRGFRVELGEIENALLALGQFRHTAVIVDSRKRIVAFVAKPCNAASTGDSVRAELAQRLPDYMVPWRVIVLEEFPSTANGKIDRAQLQEVAARLAPKVLVDSLSLTAVEARLRAMWADLLGIDVDGIGCHSSFFDLGGHSLLVSRLMLAVKREFSGTPPLVRFMERPTVAGLARLLTDVGLKKGEQIPLRIRDDMPLPAQITPPVGGSRHKAMPQNVLVTGATGFLGTALVAELLAQTTAGIHCFVRADSNRAAALKLDQAFMANGLHHLCSHPRLHVVCGDLSRPGLGLSPTDRADLADTIDAIYHNGAHVNHVYDYDRLYGENVQSTLELLHLAVERWDKPFHFISTLSAASTTDERGRVTESGPTSTPPVYVNNGYNLTKWVSEHLVWQAAARGVDATIVRPGNIVGHSSTGVCIPHRNRILLLLKGCIQLGYAPAAQISFDLSPVDFVARAIVACTTSGLASPRVIHLQNRSRISWNQYLEALAARGYLLTQEAPERWRKRLEFIDEANALFDILAFYLDDKQEDIGDMSFIDCEQTAGTLARLGIAYPDLGETLLERHFGYLIDSGFFPRPSNTHQRRYPCKSPLLIA